MSKSRMQVNWELARDDLGLDLEIPFNLNLGNGETIHAELLVKNFGGRKGIIIVRKYGTVERNLEQIQKLGFGFSVLDEPRGPYDRATMIEMLSDWGWAGPASEAPKWMVPSE